MELFAFCFLVGRLLIVKRWILGCFSYVGFSSLCVLYTHSFIHNAHTWPSCTPPSFPPPPHTHNHKTTYIYIVCVDLSLSLNALC